MNIPVFRSGKWIVYEAPTDIPLWSKSLKLQVASVYASFLSKGFSKEKSSVLAECYANKQLYGVTYSKEIETQLQSLFV